MRNLILTGLLVAISLSSCNTTQSKIDHLEANIEFAEQNQDGMIDKDWSTLELNMQDLEKDLEQNRDKYTAEQVKAIGKLQGRYFAVAVKKGIDDFQESVKDLSNQMEGFIEGITDTIKKNN
jgi:bisphosphoglycerate-independent phosphoglycerate mutase (AlkP superfamily)